MHFTAFRDFHNCTEYALHFFGKRCTRVTAITQDTFNQTKTRLGKKRLQFIHESPIDYVVIFSGKKSKKVNGLYKSLTKEIIIHNKNFVDENGKQHENFLIFTAIHELAHHVMIAECGNKSAHAHNQDFIERKAQISKQSAKVAVAAYDMGDQKVDIDIQIESAKQRDEEKRIAIIASGHGCKSVVHAKKPTAPARSIDAEDEAEMIIREKRRIERTIETLIRRLEEIEQQLITRGEDSGGES
jgi:hypothetical protein